MNTDRQLILALKDRIQARLAVIYERIQDDRTKGKAVISLILRYEAVSDTKDVLSSNGMIDILNNDLFEIYVCNAEPVKNGLNPSELAPAGTIGGWEIKWILAPSEEAIKQYPFFDEIITQNDNSTGRARTAELFTP